MKRGEIYYAHLDPTIGAEIKKKRPVVIISNDANNETSPTITILPITSNVKKIYPFEVFLEPKQSGLPKASKVQCQQIRTVSKLRIKGKAEGKVVSSIMTRIENALMLHLAID